MLWTLPEDQQSRTQRLINQKWQRKVWILIFMKLEKSNVDFDLRNDWNGKLTKNCCLPIMFSITRSINRLIVAAAEYVLKVQPHVWTQLTVWTRADDTKSLYVLSAHVNLVFFFCRANPRRGTSWKYGLKVKLLSCPSSQRHISRIWFHLITLKNFLLQNAALAVTCRSGTDSSLRKPLSSFITCSRPSEMNKSEHFLEHLRAVALLYWVWQSSQQYFWFSLFPKSRISSMSRVKFVLPDLFCFTWNHVTYHDHLCCK